MGTSSSRYTGKQSRKNDNVDSNVVMNDNDNDDADDMCLECL